MYTSLSNRLLVTVMVCSLLLQGCGSGLRAITEEPAPQEDRSKAADPVQASGEALLPGALALVPSREDARVSGASGRMSPTELAAAVVPASPRVFMGPFTASSGERVLLSRQQGQWQALLQGGAGAVMHGRALPVVGSGDIRASLEALQGQDAWSSRSRIHVLSAPPAPLVSPTQCVYVGRLGLLGGMPESPSRKKQLHSEVVIAPGKEVRIPYPFPLGWRYLSHCLHVVQEVPGASHHVNPFQANFSYSSSDQEGRNQHHSTSQVASGPSASIPMVGVEADLRMGRHSSQAQGAQHYATSSICTTHDGLELHASVPRTYKKKGQLLGLYKDVPITQSLKLQLEVILERDGSSPSLQSPSFSSGADQGDTKPPASQAQQRREYEEKRAAEARARLAEEELAKERARLAKEKEARLAKEKEAADQQARLAKEKQEAEARARLAEEELAKERARLAKEKEQEAWLAKEKEAADQQARLAKEKREAEARARLAEEELAKLKKQALLSQTTLPSQAFGAQAWAQYFGEVATVPPPAGIDNILNSKCPFCPGKQVKDTHLLVLIPAKVNGKPFSLNLLRELIKYPKGGGHATEYSHYGSDTQKQFGTQSPECPYWVLMTRDVLEGSRSKTYSAQKALVAKHAPYALPGALEAATAILSHYVRSRDRERLYSDNPLTYTRCRELEDGEYPVVVGGFSSGGLRVISDNDGCHSSGVAGLRKF